MTKELEGILVLNKPTGFTSHDCVGKIRRLTGIKRVGHTGTLDPAVTGVLPICIGRATRVVEYVQEHDKEYICTMVLGKSTTTEDAEGEIIEDQPVHQAPSQLELEKALAMLHGEIEQIPPMFSAVKVGGKRLHELARKGEVIERKARKVTIYSLDLLEYDATLPYPTITFKVRCSKGTYVRTLSVDIGKQLGFPAHMLKLARSKSGPFSLEQAVNFETIESWDEDDWQKHLYGMDYVLHTYVRIDLTEALAFKVRVGQPLELDDRSIEPGALYRLYSPEGDFMALYEGVSSTKIKAKKVFYQD